MGTTSTTATAKPARGVDRDRAIALAQTITGSRQQFADAFRRAQAGRPTVLEFEAVASARVDQTAAFTLAILRAAEDGWLAELCFACLDGQIDGDGFVAAAKAMCDDKRLARLQQRVDERGTKDAKLFPRRLLRAQLQVCRIDIEGQPTGTGFLIRSDLVMTAYHVIKPLLQADNTESPGSAGKLRVKFDYSRTERDGEVTLREGFVCQVADPWLVKTSPCTPEELLDLLPEDEEKLNGFWDFAVIRLAELPGVARTGLEVSELPVTRGHRLTILQHPYGGPMAFDNNTVRRFLGLGAFRIVHRVNTEPGSSGSPCLNDEFKVVGLHQAAMPDGPKRRRKASEDEKENRAVPMPRILGFWKLKDAPPVAPHLRPQRAVDTKRIQQHPVFGRINLQQWVGLSAAGGGVAAETRRERFLVVSGPKGSGKSFTIDIVKGMLTAGEHSVLACKASDFNKESTLGFAEKYLLGPLGADASTLPELSQADTSDNAWLNHQLMSRLLDVMDQSRKGRMVWLMLDELDEVSLPDQGQVRKLLDLLYARAESTPWLRFVLLGLEGVPIPEMAQFTERQFLGTTTEAVLEQDVGDYLVRSFEAKGKSYEEAFVRTIADLILRWCMTVCGGNLQHPELMKTIADETIAVERKHGLRTG
ncbi:MAG: hypothetical protein QOF89_2601 [Acidobacteriota bacterium]|jgi:energy-coupling factor transporter ATP-binding protein EcfA2|nr:hypothetical protein [Acidobacteriota bacterium]